MEAENAKLLEAAKPLIDYLNSNHNPHVTAVVTGNGVELVEGILNVQIPQPELTES